MPVIDRNSQVWFRHHMEGKPFRRLAVRYWERRRIVYNLAIALPAFISYGLTDVINYVGDSHPLNYGYLCLLFGLSALGANICYSLVYALEFFLGSDEPTSRWIRFGRTTVFVGGVLFAMLLALFCGWNIAELDYHHGVHSD
jgi:hypothetical protein